jgi:hypothetical protein
MVSKTRDYVAWVSVVQELDDANEHLRDLVRRMIEDSAFDEADLRIGLGHIYSHRHN